jgi:eukaryotic-like serine/threonine-protein kinase
VRGAGGGHHHTRDREEVHEGGHRTVRYNAPHVMPLNVGSCLGPYEILSSIGAGGMGEVYKAKDTRLGRDVAVKVAAGQFSDRFEREARAVSALNHPHICALYDVGPNYLVMELVEGTTLRGPMPMAEALTAARQIAEALEAAHEKGITHRDLKPANIKITPGGMVNVLDFGLAKLASASQADVENSPTIRLSSTEEGVIFKTPASSYRVEAGVLNSRNSPEKRRIPDRDP